jgi:hypothetical protein
MALVLIGNVSPMAKKTIQDVLIATAGILTPAAKLLTKDESSFY